MATAEKSPFGQIRGQLRGVVSRKMKNGNMVLYDYNAPKNREMSIAQQTQVDRFKYVNKFVSATLDYVKKCKGSSGKVRYEAVSQNLKRMKEANLGEGEAMDYSKIVLADGDFVNVNNGTVSVTDDKVTFRWNGKITPAVRGKDIAMPLVYNESRHEAVFECTSYKRADGVAELEIPSYWKGDTIHCYMSIKENNGTRLSDTLYLGNMTA